METRIITGRYRRDLEEALFERIAARKRDDPLSPVWVLVGSNLLGIHLRGRLALRMGGHINVRFLTFADLIRLLDEQEARAAPALAERAIVEELVSSGGLPPPFEEISGTAGFGDALFETFTDLIEGGCGAEIAEDVARGTIRSESFGPRTRALFGLYGRFLGALGGESALDRASRVRSRLASGEGTGDIEGPLLAYGFYDFNNLQLGLIESLGSAVGVLLFAPATGGGPDRFSDPVLGRLEKRGWRIERAGSVPRSEPEIELFNAPGEEEEARALVRRVIETAERYDAPFGGMGILLPSKEIYLPLVTEALGEAGVPYYCTDVSEGSVRAARRGVELLLGMISRGMERAALVDFLSSAPLASVEGAGDAYGLWILKSAEAGMTGAGGWSAEDTALRERLAREGGGADSGTLRAVDAVRRIVETIEDLRRAAAERMNWSGFSALLLSLIHI